MEDNKQKCSFKEHKDIDAKYYCPICKLYYCNKCLNYHQGFFENHNVVNLSNKEEIFTNICQEKNHNDVLEFYCKNHNKLCCVACTSKFEAKGYGQHKDCDVCIIENIKEEKRNKLKDNIKYLEDLSNNLNDSIKELKELFDKIVERKEELKLKILNIFTKIRTALNEREDELLNEVDNKYNEIYGNEDIIKESEKLPNKIKISLEKGKLIDNEWNDDNKLSFNINNCINIEDNIKNINTINDNIKKCGKNNDIKIEFIIEKEHFDNFINTIKSLGNIYDIDKDSKILTSKEDIKKFNDLLSTQIKITNMKLLYRSSRDGLELNKLKEKIDNKCNLIFLFLTGTTRIFGSYIKSKIIVNHDTYTNDKNAFVFSLNNNKIYKILMPEYAIRFYNGHPVLIGKTAQGNGFWIDSGKLGENLLQYPKIYDFQKKEELTEGTNEFKELEVFEIFN